MKYAHANQLIHNKRRYNKFDYIEKFLYILGSIVASFKNIQENDSQNAKQTTLLRQKAEDSLHKEISPHRELSLEETQTLIHELQVHQIELQMQNNELERIHNSLEETIEQYLTLYNEAPIGYFELDSNLIIQKVNDTALKLLGFDYADVEDSAITKFIFRDDQDSFYLFKKQFTVLNEVNSCELRMVKNDGSHFWVLLQINIDNENDLDNVFRLSFHDISDKKKYEQQLKKNYEETIYSFVNITEQKDSYTAGHAQRVAFYSSKIAENMGMDTDTINKVYKASMLHDIGKIVVPEAILLKPGSFTEVELQLMREHPQSGFDILSSISMYDEIADIILYHHEHYDGSGYPFGKKGNEIPLISQLLSISDTFDAMTTNRIYKARKSVKQAIDELKSLSGIWFEPKLLEHAIAFLTTLPEVKQVNQLPDTELEKQRFAYFFKDKLTNVYNGDYLNVHLQENNISHTYECLNFIKLHNMGEYNTLHGWDKGNELLINISNKLQEVTDCEHIYRVYGDDFIILNKKHMELDLNIINDWEIIKDTCISIELKHYNLRDTNIDSWQKLEMALE